MKSRALMAVVLWGLMSARASAADPVTVKWLENAPATQTGLSWGVPWPRGAVQKGQAFSLRAQDGATLPLQTWPLAYWPDGSLKWTGHATIAGPGNAGPFQVVPADAAAAGGDIVSVTENAAIINISTGPLQVRIARTGSVLIDSMSLDGRELARRGRLEMILQNGPETDPLTPRPREQFISNIKKVTVEQSGPVRAVVKFEGMHKSASGSREWLPFVVRLYFYAGQQPVKMVHTITFDGDQEKDLIRGLGVTFEVPFREEAQNRHVRFGNSNGGVLAEPVLLPAGGFGGRGRGRGRGGDAADGQPPAPPPVGPLDGGRVGPTNSELARWGSYKLTQLSSEGFTITKRTNPPSRWIQVGEGNRASGLVFFGDVSGGLGVAVKDFWQSHPASLEVHGGEEAAGQMQVWLWSPDGPAMDMRHYDTRGHGPVNQGSGSYEDYEKEFATPEGVARTSELTLFLMGKTPTREETSQMARIGSAPPLLVTSPEYLHATGIFGPWSLPDRSTPYKQFMEERLDFLVDFYQKQIAQHHWYGYWNFGDIMHQYDGQRHQWRYDVGGYAWDNTELGSPLWLWAMYIRTGRADIFRMAQAMTRHNSEVDTHHIGRFAGLGSRHNVSHWGDSAKEARVSQSSQSRFLYYLTTDERLGDVMSEVTAVVDKVAAELDPMRKAQPKTPEEAKYPGRIRVGPDWLAFVGNWMTEWERTGDTKWRDKIMAGVDSMYEMPYWMRTGENLVMGYDPATGKLYQVDGRPGRYNLPTIQGGAEVAFELTELLNEPKWTKMWLQYCRLGTASAEVLLRDKETGTEGADSSLVGESGGQGNQPSQGSARLAAYAYMKTKTPAFAEFAIRELGAPRWAAQGVIGAQSLNPVEEAPGVSTNEAAQWSLKAIEILEMCKDRLPTQVPPAPAGRGFGGGRGRGGQGRGNGGQ